MTTPERTVEEIVEEFENNCLIAGTTIIDNYKNWLTQTLQAERQKREEMVEAVKLQVEKEILSCVTAEGEDYYFLRVAKDSSLFITQPNNK